MATPVLRGAAGFNNGSASSVNLSVTFPTSLAVGDQMLIWVGCGTTSLTWTCSAPVSGTAFTAVTAVSGASGAAQLLYKTADAQDVTNAAASTAYVAVCSVSHLIAGVAAAYSGVSAFDPAPLSGQYNVSSTTLGAASITTTVNGDMLAWFGVTTTGAGGAPAVITVPSSPAFTARTTQSNNTSGAGTNAGVLMGDFTQTTAGATGAVNGTLASGHISIGLVVGMSGSTTTLANAALATATGVPPAAADSVTLNMTIQGV